MLTFLMTHLSTPQDLKLFWLLLYLCCCVTPWPQADDCPSSEWSAMCRPCCEYHLIQCRCPSKGSKVGYTVPCCRNALDQCDPCIIHPGCSLFENCKTCHNGTWKANDNFFVNGKYCTECRQGWSGGDCKTCGGVIQRAQGHIAMESYPTNARCEWMVRVERDSSIELRFSQLSLEPDHNCRYDYVEVRDGDDLSSPVIGRYCGDRLPPPIRSSGNLLHILFSSDGYNNLDGFVLTFQESPGQTSRVRCSPPPTLLNGHHRPAPDTAGGAETIEFSCKKPYILSGNHRSTCLSNGSWSSRPPKCVRACREPKISELVRQSVVRPHLRSRENPHQRNQRLSRYNMHDVLSAGFIPLRLDKQLKKDDDDAFMDLPRGFHPVHTTIEYKCASTLYRHTGSSQRTCLKSGRWSGGHVSCSPVCGKFDISSPHNHTDAPWPWHAAIYIRSSPDQTASTHQPRGLVMSIQQGASEQSTFWYLACSGALLSQRGVLVAAQCVVNKDNEQTLHPAHVKVVIGMQSQISKGRLKSLPQLRVSDILVHPKFDSSPDAHVAVLKLKDKARISEHVLPVCLPKVQGGEVTAQEAHTARWISPNDHILHPIRHTPSSQTRLVELVDIAQCERKFARGGAYTAAISDNTLCVIRKPSSHESLCRSVVPGITTVPAYRTGHGETQEASSTHWQLLGLESFSPKEENCHQQTYTVQTSIANFRDWIKNNIK